MKERKKEKKIKGIRNRKKISLKKSRIEKRRRKRERKRERERKEKSEIIIKNTKGKRI